MQRGLAELKKHSKKLLKDPALHLPLSPERKAVVLGLSGTFTSPAAQLSQPGLSALKVRGSVHGDGLPIAQSVLQSSSPHRTMAVGPLQHKDHFQGMLS